MANTEENREKVEFRVGNYKILGQAAEHTYVYTIKNGATTGFLCYGGIHYDGGRMTAWGDEVLARTIVCFDPGDIRSEYGRTSGGYMNAGDSSGIKYGLSGVCHQMANRILVSCDGRPQVNKITPSSSVSYMLYGAYGKDGTSAPRWSVYLAQCQAKAKNYTNEMKEFDAKKYLLDGVTDKFTRDINELELDNYDDPELPVKRMKLLVNTACPESIDNGLMAGLEDILRSIEEKREQIIKGVTLESLDERPDFYAEMNNIANLLIERFKKLLTAEQFYKIFGFKSEDEFLLIDKSQYNCM